MNAQSVTPPFDSSARCRHQLDLWVAGRSGGRRALGLLLRGSSRGGRVSAGLGGRSGRGGGRVRLLIDLLMMMFGCGSGMGRFSSLALDRGLVLRGRSGRALCLRRWVLGCGCCRRLILSDCR